MLAITGKYIDMQLLYVRSHGPPTYTDSVSVSVHPPFPRIMLGSERCNFSRRDRRGIRRYVVRMMMIWTQWSACLPGDIQPVLKDHLQRFRASDSVGWR